MKIKDNVNTKQTTPKVYQFDTVSIADAYPAFQQFITISAFNINAIKSLCKTILTFKNRIYKIFEQLYSPEEYNEIQAKIKKAENFEAIDKIINHEYKKLFIKSYLKRHQKTIGDMECSTVISRLYYHEIEYCNKNNILNDKLKFEIAESYKKIVGNNSIFLPSIEYECFVNTFKQVSWTTISSSIGAQGLKLLSKLETLAKDPLISPYSSIKRLNILLDNNLEFHNSIVQTYNDHDEKIIKRFLHQLVSALMLNDQKKKLSELINNYPIAKDILREYLVKPLIAYGSLDHILQQKLELWDRRLANPIQQLPMNVISPPEQKELIFNLITQFYEAKHQNKLKELYNKFNNQQKKEANPINQYIIGCIKISILFKLGGAEQIINEKNKLEIIHQQHSKQLEVIDTALNKFSIFRTGYNINSMKLYFKNWNITGILCTLPSNASQDFKFVDIDQINTFAFSLTILGQICSEYGFYDEAKVYFSNAICLTPSIKLYNIIEKFIENKELKAHLDIDEVASKSYESTQKIRAYLNKFSDEQLMANRQKEESSIVNSKNLDKLFNKETPIPNLLSPTITIIEPHKVITTEQDIKPDVEAKIDEPIEQGKNVNNASFIPAVLLPKVKQPIQESNEIVYPLHHRYNNAIKIQAKISYKLKLDQEQQKTFVAELEKGEFCSCKHYQNGVKFLESERGISYYELKTHNEDRLLGYLDKSTNCIVFTKLCGNKKSFNNKFTSYREKISQEKQQQKTKKFQINN